MDGLESRKDVFVISATNRPDVIDPAMLRPGRLDKLISVDLPDVKGREEIFAACIRAKNFPIDPSMDLSLLASDKRCEGFSGADIAALLREASMAALERSLFSRGFSLEIPPSQVQLSEPSLGEFFIKMEHFEIAFTKVFRSVSEKDEKYYLSLKKQLKRDSTA
eukprot:TRINITY_DN4686_c0_g1_i3.p2 TRINITY_DN4686_c0_g1~~TRINITY_DN4686_c0_g1_i3.p2  ORF type:complete len:164 (+),score=44.81 TRINITY_DN4686_c0_g1_i3:241-732(+)